LLTGGAIYLAGLTIETVADAQKWFFKQDSSKVGQFCNIGLWCYSQHPNWFGNLLLWGGILIINLPSLIEPLPDNNEAANFFYDYGVFYGLHVNYYWHVLALAFYGHCLMDNQKGISQMLSNLRLPNMGRTQTI